LQILLQKKVYQSWDLFYYNDLWNSYMHHGKFSGISKEEVLDTINRQITESAEFLLKSDYLIITLGTAWVYQLKNSGQVVSNCHKVPSNEFVRKMLTVTEIVNSFELIINELRKINPGIKIIFTISPVRHWKETAHGNQLSKSTLLLAVNELLKQVSHTFYFPSYEILLDELRDYRFYADDMLHPSDLAINYIWERFSETCFSVNTQALLKKIDQINKGMFHKPFNENTSAHIRFKNNLLQQIVQLKTEFPYIKF